MPAAARRAFRTSTSSISPWPTSPMYRSPVAGVEGPAPRVAQAEGEDLAGAAAEPRTGCRPARCTPAGSVTLSTSTRSSLPSRSSTSWPCSCGSLAAATVAGADVQAGRHVPNSIIPPLWLPREVVASEMTICPVGSASVGVGRRGSCTRRSRWRWSRWCSRRRSAVAQRSRGGTPGRAGRCSPPATRPTLPSLMSRNGSRQQPSRLVVDEDAAVTTRR
jgi:hypothetical protein